MAYVSNIKDKYFISQQCLDKRKDVMNREKIAFYDTCCIADAIGISSGYDILCFIAEAKKYNCEIGMVQDQDQKYQIFPVFTSEDDAIAFCNIVNAKLTLNTLKNY